MQKSSLHCETVIFFGVQPSSGQKTHEIEEIRVFQEAPSLLYRARVNSPPSYWAGCLILMQTSSLHRETAIFFGVQPSFERKTHKIEEIRVFQEAPSLLYRARVNSPPPYWAGDLMFMQTSSVYCETAIFFGFQHSSRRKTHEIEEIRVFKRPHLSTQG